MTRRTHALVALLAVTGIAVLSAGCSEDEQATPRVTFDSSIGVGSAGATKCPEKSGTWFTIGSFGNPALGRKDETNPESELVDPVRPVEDGANDQQGVVGITCSVIAAGDGFDVKATAQLTGATGGFFQLIGRFTPTGPQSNLEVVLSRQGSSYRAKDCTAVYSTPLQTVASGRVWADITCDKIINESLDRECRGTAQVRFENCGQ